jgi:hypothetical protein
VIEYVPGEPNALHSMNMEGNAHSAAYEINRRLPELVDHVIQIEFAGGNYSTVLFRAPASLITRLKEAKRI